MGEVDRLSLGASIALAGDLEDGSGWCAFARLAKQRLKIRQGKSRFGDFRAWKSFQIRPRRRAICLGNDKILNILGRGLALDPQEAVRLLPETARAANMRGGSEVWVHALFGDRAGHRSGLNFGI
ncbi:hypothetical protein ACFX5Q_20225 [Mesorhizobium sp. IMUNJ 23033]|uniref:hypothetical protein n=1 Tax=Mesorhizobium sp. IMUNJ 23033 TaxID=3378039 RepID=UPI0038513B25